MKIAFKKDIYFQTCNLHLNIITNTIFKENLIQVKWEVSGKVYKWDSDWLHICEMYLTSW